MEKWGRQGVVLQDVFRETSGILAACQPAPAQLLRVRAHHPGALREALTGLDGQKIVELMQQLQQGRLLLGLTELEEHRTSSQQRGDGRGGSVYLARPPRLYCQGLSSPEPRKTHILQRMGKYLVNHKS